MKNHERRTVILVSGSGKSRKWLKYKGVVNWEKLKNSVEKAHDTKVNVVFFYEPGTGYYLGGWNSSVGYFKKGNYPR